MWNDCVQISRDFLKKGVMQCTHSLLSSFILYIISLIHYFLSLIFFFFLFFFTFFLSFFTLLSLILYFLSLILHFLALILHCSFSNSLLFFTFLYSFFIFSLFHYFLSLILFFLSRWSVQVERIQNVCISFIINYFHCVFFFTNLARQLVKLFWKISVFLWIGSYNSQKLKAIYFCEFSYFFLNLKAPIFLFLFNLFNLIILFFLSLIL